MLEIGVGKMNLKSIKQKQKQEAIPRNLNFKERSRHREKIVKRQAQASCWICSIETLI